MKRIASAALAFAANPIPIDPSGWPERFPAKDHCSRCGLCETTYVKNVEDACAFLGPGMGRIDDLEVKAVLDSSKDYICSGTGNFWSYVGELFLADFASTIYKAVNGPIQDAINDEFDNLITQYHLNRCQWAVPSSAPTAGPTSVPSYSPSPGPTSEPTYPCTELAAPVCAGPTEPCYYDPACLDSGGFGCNAGGYQACRFCGFGTLPDCPSPAPSPVPTTITTTNT